MPRSMGLMPFAPDPGLYRCNFLSWSQTYIGLRGKLKFDLKLKNETSMRGRSHVSLLNACRVRSASFSTWENSLQLHIKCETWGTERGERKGEKKWNFFVWREPLFNNCFIHQLCELKTNPPSIWRSIIIIKVNSSHPNSTSEITSPKNQKNAKNGEYYKYFSLLDLLLKFLSLD